MTETIRTLNAYVVRGPSGEAAGYAVYHHTEGGQGRDWRWMTRLVDLADAVGARGWPDGIRTEVHLDVDDALAPWNAGRWVLTVEDGRGRLEFF